MPASLRQGRASSRERFPGWVEMKAMITIDMIDDQIKHTEKPEIKRLRTRTPILGFTLIANLFEFANERHATLLRQADIERALKIGRNGAHHFNGR